MSDSDRIARLEKRLEAVANLLEQFLEALQIHGDRTAHLATFRAVEPHREALKATPPAAD